MFHISFSFFFSSFLFSSFSYSIRERRERSDVQIRRAYIPWTGPGVGWIGKDETFQSSTWDTRLPRRTTPISPLFENQGKSTVYVHFDISTVTSLAYILAKKEKEIIVIITIIILLAASEQARAYKYLIGEDIS
ncbi:unnamed protein product [Tuber aestivum]|uniref:Uncharacterized protein n=1 Tax=Tuber aestivum TaxID=59557 RepID=A0A292PZ15_9PEZI|nr:unnamed protein product [Tuber aestivum]